VVLLLVVGQVQMASMLHIICCFVALLLSPFVPNTWAVSLGPQIALLLIMFGVVLQVCVCVCV
jgi:hypothetical protein